MQACHRMAGGGAGGLGIHEFDRRHAAQGPRDLQDAGVEQAAQLLFEDDRQAKIAEFEDATRQLQELASRSPIGQIATLPADQREQAAQLQERRFELNREIRDIEAAQRAEINAVESDLRIKNIVVVPLAVIVLGLIVAIWRRVRLSNYLRRRAASA